MPIGSPVLPPAAASGLLRLVLFAHCASAWATALSFSSPPNMRSRCSSSEQTITPYSLPALDLAAESAPAHQSQPASAVDGDRPRGSSAKTGTRPGPSTGSRNSLSLRHDQPGESRPSSEHSPDLSRSTSARSARLSSSLLPALRLAGLAPDPGRERERAREMRSSSRSSRDAPSKSKALLTLKLSASSFLDSVIRDDRTKDPLYILETGSEITTIYRLDHIHDVPVKTASVRWPIHPVRVKGKSGRSVQFGAGTWREAEDILKSGPLGNTAYVERLPPTALTLTVLHAAFASSTFLIIPIVSSGSSSLATAFVYVLRLRVI